jgi:hypothetical protein
MRVARARDNGGGGRREQAWEETRGVPTTPGLRATVGLGRAVGFMVLTGRDGEVAVDTHEGRRVGMK